MCSLGLQPAVSSSRSQISDWWPHGVQHQAAREDDPIGADFQALGESMWIDPALRIELVATGLVDFDAVMDSTSGHCVKVSADQETWQLDLRAARRAARRVILRKHHVHTRRTRRMAKRGQRPTESAGRIEAQGLCELRAVGIMRLLAWGEKLRPGGLLESFVLAEELRGFTALDRYLSGRFRQRSARQTRRRDRDMDRLLREVAATLCRLHQAGYYGLDGGRFFVRESPPGNFEIRIADFNRFQDHGRVRRRRQVNELARLAWSSLADHMQCKQKLAFMRYYLGVDKLRLKDKQLIREILAKQAVLAQQS